jgi:hypothetical protein
VQMGGARWVAVRERTKYRDGSNAQHLLARHRLDTAMTASDAPPPD